MPELPEVETVKRGLSKLLPGRAVAAVEALNTKSLQAAAADIHHFLIGASVVAVERRAKVLLIELSSKYSLVIHLKMTGQLVFRGPDASFGAGHPTDSLVAQLPDRSTRVILEFTDGSRLFFNDQRKFGWVKLLPTVEVPQLNFFQKLGPEPLSADFSWRDFQVRLMRRRGTSIKAALLDQTVVAGVGNIYADESLWAARIHPATPVNKLSAAKFHKLYDELAAVLRLSIAKGGSTDKNYVDAEGRKGSYLAFAKVFRREGQPCPRCGRPILKTRVAGRGTHLCSHCQKLPPQH